LIRETRGKVIEQLRVARWLRLHAHVIQGADEPIAEVMRPESVDHHAGGKRVALAGNRLGELEPAAADGEGLAVLAADDLKELVRHDRPAVLGLAADEDG